MSSAAGDVGAGVEGGFDVGEKKYDIEELCSVLVMPGWQEFPLLLPGLPDKVIFFGTKTYYVSVQITSKLHCVSKNIIDCNLKKNYPLLVIFGMNISDTTGHQMTIQVPTSPKMSASALPGKTTEQAKYALK